MLKFHYLTSTQFAAIDTKAADHLYFITDTLKIYKGDVEYTKSVKLVSEFPSQNIAQGILYINTTTGESKTYNGTAWTTVVRPVDTEVTENSTNLITSGAVYTAIDDAIGDIDYSSFVTNLTWDDTNHKFVLTKGAATSDINLTKVATQIDYNATTGIITLQDAAGTALDTINIPLDNFVTAGSYNDTSKKIELTMQNGDLVEIPAQDLIDLYYGGTTSTTITSVSAVNVTAQTFTVGDDKFCKVDDYAVSLANFIAGNTGTTYKDNDATAAMGSATLTSETVDTKETITVDVRLASATDVPNNALQIHANGGLYVDVSDKVDKLTSGGFTTGDIATVSAAGGIADSGKTIGGATITLDAGTNNDEASADRLATEAAVAAYATKKTVPTVAGEVATLTATGDLAASGKIFGGATITRDSGTNNDEASTNRLATEAAVDAAIAGAAYIPTSAINTDLTTGTPTDNQVPSAAAIIDLLTWETHSDS